MVVKPGLWLTYTSIFLVFFFADFAPFTKYDAVVVAIFLSLLIPSLSVYILIVLVTYQDAPGISGVWWYVAFISVGSITFLWACRSGLSYLRNNIVIYLLIGSILVVLYGVLNSYFQEYFGGIPQSDDRNPLLVGMLMIYMPVVSVFSFTQLYNREDEVFRKIIYLILIHSIIVSFMQVINVDYFHSVEGVSQVHLSDQLYVPTKIGIPRIAGTYLTPNGWAYCNILLLIFILCGTNREKSIRGFEVLFFALGCLFFSIIAFSKALLLFSVFSIIFILFIFRPRILVIAFILLASIFLTLGVMDLNLSSFSSAFRVDRVSQESYRFMMWSEILSDFNVMNWFFGVGFGYWPIFFMDHLDIVIHDPHSYIFSIPGNFGFLGVLLYFILFFVLVRKYLLSKEIRRILSALLLFLFFVKDAFSYPYFLGNTPLTFMIWGLLTVLFQSGNTNIVLPRQFGIDRAHSKNLTH